MIDVQLSERFKRWLAGLRDPVARTRIAMRLRRAEAGQLGDVKSVGGGLIEMRIDYGPGYRLYFIRRGSSMVVVLCGGDKGTQSADIALAKRLAEEA